MASSRYLEQILFKQQSPTTDLLFEEKLETLFDLGAEDSFIDIHVQRTGQKTRKGQTDADHDRQNCHEQLSEINIVSKEVLRPGSSGPPSPVDMCNILAEEPPVYVEAQGLQPQKVRNSQDLSIIVSSSGCDRFCFIRQRHSYSRLQINRKLFETLLFEFEIFSRFKEFVVLFGWKHEETEVGHPQLRFHTLKSHITAKNDGAIEGFECAYALRYAELNNRNTGKPWSLRQTAIYHRYDMKIDTSTWVMISASEKMEKCVDCYIKSLGASSAQNPFDVHVLLFDTALANWRPFLINSTQRVNEQSDKVLVASIDGKATLQQLDVEQRQILKDLEDELLDVILVFDSMHGTLSKLIRNYSQCLLTDLSNRPDKGGGFDYIREALFEKCEDIILHRKQVQTLLKKLRGTINLLSDILDLGNGLSLRQLAEEARNENVLMRRLAEKTTQDAAAVKVLTIITLIYLPATVVSNFFSSQFVSTKNDSDLLTVELTSNAWLFAAISVPLTLITIAVWWAWIRFQAFIAKRGTRPLLSPLKTVWTPEPKPELSLTEAI